MLVLTVFRTVWPSGLRRWLKAPVRKDVGSNPTAVNSFKQLVPEQPEFAFDGRTQAKVSVAPRKDEPHK